MSKNISVKVDGEATNLTVDKLRTNKQGGGSMDWSPESDTDVSNLRVRRNGTYTADDMGVFGFDSIDVDITGHGGGAGAELVGDPHTGESVPNDITIKEGNISRTMSGVQCLKVDKQGSGKQQFYNIETGTLSVTKEGTYKAKNDRKYAYTSVTVNVPSGGGGGDDPYAPENLPTSIAISWPPFEFVYENGDTIDYHDIVVKPYKENGDLWTSNVYPNGIIPVSELVVSPTVAQYTGDGDEYDTPVEISIAEQYNISNPIISRTEVLVRTSYWEYEYYGLNIFAQVSGDTFRLWGCSENNSTFTYRFRSRGSSVWTETTSSLGQYTFNGHTYFYGSLYSTSNQVEANIEPVTGPPEIISYCILFGDTYLAPTPQHIDVSWPRPGDGMMLVSSGFTITVYPEGGNPYGNGEVISEGGTGVS